jgi:hypothetical protein
LYNSAYRWNHLQEWVSIKIFQFSFFFLCATELYFEHDAGKSQNISAFKTIPDPMADGPTISHTADFKANRGVSPATVVEELKSNVSDYISQIEFELKIAIGLKKSIEDVSSIVEHVAELNKEIPGASVVDMQVSSFLSTVCLCTWLRIMA